MKRAILGAIPIFACCQLVFGQAPPASTAAAPDSGVQRLASTSTSTPPPTPAGERPEVRGPRMSMCPRRDTRTSKPFRRTMAATN